MQHVYETLFYTHVKKPISYNILLQLDTFDSDVLNLFDVPKQYRYSTPVFCQCPALLVMRQNSILIISTRTHIHNKHASCVYPHTVNLKEASGIIIFANCNWYLISKNITRRNGTNLIVINPAVLLSCSTKSQKYMTLAISYILLFRY